MIKAWTLACQIITTLEDNDKKEINSMIEELVVKPQALDQSKRVKLKHSRSLLSELDTSSKVRTP